MSTEGVELSGRGARDVIFVSLMTRQRDILHTLYRQPDSSDGTLPEDFIPQYPCQDSPLRLSGVARKVDGG